MATLRRSKAVRVLGGTALMLAFVAVGLYPLYEGIPLLRLVGSGVLNRLRGRHSPTPSPAASSSSSIGHDEKVPVSPSGETSS